MVWQPSAPLVHTFEVNINRHSTDVYINIETHIITQFSADLALYSAFGSQECRIAFVDFVCTLSYMWNHGIVGHSIVVIWDKWCTTNQMQRIFSCSEHLCIDFWVVRVDVNLWSFSFIKLSLTILASVHAICGTYSCYALAVSKILENYLEIFPFFVLNNINP